MGQRVCSIAIPVCFTVLMSLAAGASATDFVRNRVGDNFEIVSSVIAGGGATAATNGCFSLDGTLGQSVVGRASGGDFVLEAGFWMHAPRQEVIFKNGFESGVCPP